MGAQGFASQRDARLRNITPGRDNGTEERPHTPGEGLPVRRRRTRSQLSSSSQDSNRWQGNVTKMKDMLQRLRKYKPWQADRQPQPPVVRRSLSPSEREPICIELEDPA